MAVMTEGGVEPWLARVHALAPMVARYRDEAEHERRLPQPLFQALRDAGFFGLWVPRNLGGAEVDVETSVRCVEELSRLDGAVGWNVMIAANTSILWANLQYPVAAEMVDGGRNAVIAGTVTSAPRMARRGPTPLRSQHPNATSWTPGTRLECAALAATISKRATCSCRRVVISRRAGDRAIKRARSTTRTSITCGVRISPRLRSVLRVPVQEKVGQAEALVRSGRAFLYETIRETWRLLAAGQEVPEELTAVNRLAAAAAVEYSIQAVDLIFTLGGTTSIYEDRQLERCFRIGNRKTKLDTPPRRATIATT